jgi:hypothetical protein
MMRSQQSARLIVYTGSGKVNMVNYKTRGADESTPLSVDTIYGLINTSIQSGKPLWLCGANLRWSNLWHANLSGADLRGADLSGADMHGANLIGADLRYARLRDSNLRGALLNSVDLSKTDLTAATYDTHTKWPEGFNPEATGAVLDE